MVLPGKAGAGGVVVSVEVDDSSLASLAAPTFTIPEGEVAGEVEFSTLTSTGSTFFTVKVGAVEKATPLRVDP